MSKIGLKAKDQESASTPCGYLIFDCETTGLPRARTISASNLDYWPHIVSLAWMLTDKERNVLERKYYVIRPEGFIIPSQSTKIHGISTEYALAHGEPIELVMSEFLQALSCAETVVAHNLEFDRQMVRAECLRLRINSKANVKRRLCTMAASIDYCAIPFPSGQGYKFPRLEELYHKLFGKVLEGAHNALIDVEACAECFFEMLERGIIGA